MKHKHIKTPLIKQLMPLFIIIGCVLLMSIFITFLLKQSSLFFVQVYMGLFFVTFASIKLPNISGFSEGFKTYDPIAKRFNAYGLVYPFVELLLGFLFLTGLFVNIANVTTIIVLGTTTIGILKNLVKHKKIKCACLGTVFNVPLTYASLIENLVMITMAVLMLSI